MFSRKGGGFFLFAFTIGLSLAMENERWELEGGHGLLMFTCLCSCGNGGKRERERVDCWLNRCCRRDVLVCISGVQCFRHHCAMLVDACRSVRDVWEVVRSRARLLVRCLYACLSTSPALFAKVFQRIQ